MNSELIKIGVITEPSAAHLEIYLDSVKDCRGVRGVAIADPSGESFQIAEGILKDRLRSTERYLNHLEMINTFEPDMVVVTLESHHAAVVIRMALEANCHVLSEKPACVRAVDFADLVQLAEARRRHLMLALANRLNPLVQESKRVVESGLLGKLYGANLYFLADQTRLTNSDYQQSWWSIKSKAGGGHLIWLGIHWLDLIQYISGDRIHQVCGFSENVGGQPIEVEDASALTLKFRKGMLGTFQSGYFLDRGYQSQIAIWGSQGWLRCDLLGRDPMQWYSIHPAAPAGVQSFSDTTDYSSNEYLSFVQAAVDAIRGLREPPISGREGLSVLKVIFALYKAAETGLVQSLSDS